MTGSQHTTNNENKLLNRPQKKIFDLPTDTW